ncbi:acetylcholine receptor subunit alpha-like 2 [Gigantopelta aegis]|uniref:acetylcholine receptor subunit alpha-like 2 n=1 Tax=Gigantopelta aegis TaxID=1735272 RepID=UPI001B88AE66|nr:acetylcholine receptor subunit alpha-like 2 [Gigantopelta aegis]
MAQAQTIDDVERLHIDIFSSYNRLIRPVRNMTKTLQVHIGLFLSSVDELNVKDQVLRTKGWLSLNWTDELLSWNRSEYNGLVSIQVPETKVWLPDFMLLNQYNRKMRFGSKDTDIIIKHTGEVIWEPILESSTSCQVNIRFYPFDKQTCTFEILSWMTKKQFLMAHATQPSINLEYLTPSAEFEMEDSSVEKTLSDDLGGLLFSLTLRRKTTFYWLTIVLPLIAFPFLCPVSFLIPACSGEKITLSVTVLLSFLVFTGLINDSLPKLSNTISYCVLYTSLQTLSSLLTVVINGIIIYIDAMPPSSPMPRCLRYFEEAQTESKSNAPNGENGRNVRSSACDVKEDKTKYQDYKNIARRIDRFCFSLGLGFSVTSLFLVVLHRLPKVDVDHHPH